MHRDSGISKIIAAAYALAATAALPAYAADLPVKAKAVEYVKVCSLYGAGFYYIPGTDTCIKIGGYVRYQMEYNSGFNGIPIGSTPLAAAGTFTRDVNTLSSTARGMLSVDVRTQTEYGTLRSYMRYGQQWVTGMGSTAAGSGNSFQFERAFIQFAGFTFGRARSFFDIFTYNSIYSYGDPRISGDTILNGTNLAAYTAQFGNGLSLTLSLEETRRVNVIDGTATAFAVNGVVTPDNGGQQVPDIVASLRLDQSWGHFGVSGALHDVRGGYYTTPGAPINGHPNDEWGWAAAVGGQLNLAGGDTIGANFVYSKGAVGYATNAGNWQMYNKNNNVGVGWVVDALFDTTSAALSRDLQLTEAWSIQGAYEHIWNPQWRTSLYGGYTQINYGGTAKAIINTHLPGAAGTTPCAVPVSGAVWPPVNVPNGGGGNSCNPDFSFWQVGSRTQFSPVRNLDIGIDVTYTRLNSAYRGTAANLYPANGFRPAIAAIDNQDVWSAIFRVQRNFYP